MEKFEQETQNFESLVNNCLELINSSEIEDGLKAKCTAIINSVLGKPQNFEDPKRSAVSGLFNLLGGKDENQEVLFDYLKELIYKAG